MRERGCCNWERGLVHHRSPGSLWKLFSSFCSVLFLPHCHLDIPPSSRGSLCGTRRIWARTKWPCPKWPHSPRQAVLPGAGEEPQRLELKETMPEAVSGSDHRVGFTLFCHPSSPCRPSKWPVLPLCQSHGRLRRSRHLGARIFCPFKCQMT